MQTRTLNYKLFSVCLMLLMLMQPLGFFALPAAAQTPTPPTRGDSPADAPSHFTLSNAVQEHALTTGGTQVTVSTQTKKATFRVSDGWDLDQYLYMGSSPIDFSIDMNGYQAHPSQPSTVTLRVYDIDQQGAPGCGPEVDKVYVNGSYLGDLTGANNQWSIVTLSIPAGKLATGSNHFQVLIDTTNSGCWEVEVDYAVVEIPFNIAQVEASAFDDVAIKRGKTDTVITDPIWITSFTPDGDLTTPSLDDPIADKITSSLGAREFKYKYKVATWPSGAQPIWTPKVRYAWEILGTAFQGSGESTAWEKDLSITLPDKVGKYTLKVALAIYQDNTLLRTDERMHTLYVLWDTPKNETFSGVSTAQPRAAWLDYATTWASGQGVETDILLALVNGEYGNPRHWNYIDTLNSPVTLIENDNEDANCYVFRDVWRLLAASLGLSTGENTYDPHNHFMTSTRPALDNRYADARPVGSTIADRWRFVRHALGTYGDTYYDPTFGLVGTNREENVFCVVDGYAPDGRLNCRVLIPPPARALLREVASENPWGMFEYEIFATLSALQQAVTPNPAAPGKAALTGNSTDSGYDMDGNGLFEHLRVDVQVNVTTAGDRGFVAYVVDSRGNPVTPGSLDPDLHRTSPATFATLDAGVHSVPLYFSGAAICAAGLDGPYTVKVELTDEAGASLDSASSTTAAYNHEAFQGLLFEVQSITDSGVDTDALPGYNVLRVSVELNALAAGTAKIQGQLFAGETLLGDATRTIALDAGSHTISLDFPGEAITANGPDGPYTVYLSITDANYTEQRKHTTAAYSHTAFQLPAASLTGASDRGIDSNVNGLYEDLDVVAEVSALTPGTYTVHGILQSSSGGFIQAGEGSVTLVAGATDAVTLHFDGTEIYRRAVVGPFQVLLALDDSAGNKVAGLAYTTGAYDITAFEHPAATFNHAFTDSGVDIDGDTLYNVLRVSVGVDVVEAGTYRIEGSLQDNEGNLITAAHREQYLAAGVQTVNQDFDGRAVNRQGVNGSYHVVGLSLTSESSSQDYILDAYATAVYAHSSFQPAGMLLTGNLRDTGQDTNGNGLYDALVIEMEVVIAQPTYYYYNARLVDAHGEEITWASGSRYLYPGTQWVALGFDGHYIYGNAVDGPHYVKDLSIYWAGETLTALDLYTTHAYGWNEFERSGRVTGAVMAAGQPVPNANIFISGIDNDLSDPSGTYKLTVVNSGTYAINIEADPALSPWQIWVNGTRVADGTSASIVVTAGAVTEVNFVSMQGANQPLTADAGGPYTVAEVGQISTNAAPVVSNDRPAPSAQYSDAIASVNGTATCTRILERRAMVAPGAYVVTVAVSDRDGDAGSTGNVIYVDQDAPGPTHNGLSWTTAYTDMQQALTTAISGTEIWVAEGIYYPGAYVSSTFVLKDGVALYGGFAATETLRTQRDWAARVTILSGDIDHDDANTDSNYIAETWADIHGNNANSIATGNGVAGTTVLDGFTVTAGSAMNDWGGGMSNIGGSPQVANVTFCGNQASSYGGGMSNYSNSNPTLTNVTFSGNRAWGGGGMYNGGMATLTNVTFSGNQAGSYGGGMYNRGNPTLPNVTFNGNQANGGSGGGMHNTYGRSPTLTNVTFNGNQAGDSGGGMYNYSSSPTLTNVTFSGNQAGDSGGGMYNYSNSSPTLANCILWGDSPDEIDNSNSLPTVTYSDVHTPTGIYSGTRNLNTDPLFVAPITATAAPTTTGNYRLLPASPAIDAGNSFSVTVPTDLDGRPRIIGAAVDMGAYEVSYRVYLPLILR